MSFAWPKRSRACWFSVPKRSVIFWPRGPTLDAKFFQCSMLAKGGRPPRLCRPSARGTVGRPRRARLGAKRPERQAGAAGRRLRGMGA